MYPAHIRPSWKSIQQTGMHQQFPALAQLTAFLHGVLPDGWRIWVRPSWCNIQFDLVIIHPKAGIIFYAVNEEASDTGCVTPQTLQNQFFRSLEQSLPDIHQFINNHPNLNQMLRFCLYSSKEQGQDIRDRILVNSKIHMVLGKDDLSEQKKEMVVPILSKSKLASVDWAWISAIESALCVFNDFWPLDVSFGGDFCPPQSVLVDDERKQYIREFCGKRKITKLIHFTHISNLESILTLGLRSHAYVDKLLASYRVTINDRERIDLQETSCSLSISFPNYRMFYRIQQHKSMEWVILELDSAILWELDCAFCMTNAANHKVCAIAIAERQKPLALEQMFGDSESQSRAALNIPDWYPTDPQAEVLVFDPISSRYIQSVHFCEDSILHEWQKLHPFVAAPELRAAKDYFSPRHDYPSWTKSTSDIPSQSS